MNITIVGLGLIGGSIARRARGFRDGFVYGIDINEESIKHAELDGVIDKGFTSGDEVLKNSDLVIMCLYPQANIDFIEKNVDKFKSDCIITDVSGVKGYVIDKLSEILPADIDFVGGHPMAGREVGGYQSSTDTLFNKASYIITPSQTNKPENVALIREFAEYIGCKHVVTTTPKEHDAIIAYTSQLMHVVAIALCDNHMIERSTFFSAGSLRDCTRVANINEKMWSELFLENSDELISRIDEMQASLEEIKQLVQSNNKSELESFMKNAKAQKQNWLME